ncbi:MAG: DUF1684 domain-containing protein, partial [Actinomycetota bacterium]
MIDRFDLPPGDPFDLLDWKRRVAETYADVRAGDPPEAWHRWRQARDELFRTHPQSPVAAASAGRFPGLTYFDYDPSYRTLATVEPADPERYDIEGSAGSSFTFTRFALAHFELRGEERAVECYWLAGY